MTPFIRYLNVYFHHLKHFFKGQGTGRKKNKQKLADKLSQSKDESKDGSNPQAKNNKKAKVLKDKTGQVVNDGEGLFQVKIHFFREIDRIVGK